VLACFSRASGRDDEVVGKVGCVDAKRDTAHGLARELPGKPRGSGAYRHIFPSRIATLSHDCKMLGSRQQIHLSAGSVCSAHRGCSLHNLRG
jgi:hypothetical protein